MKKEKIYCFDFDGTLTRCDTLLAFIRYACGTPAFMFGFLLHAPLMVLMKMGLYSNHKVKERLLRWYLGGMPVDAFNALCCQFAATNRSLLRPRAVERLHEALAEKPAAMMVVSASVDNWVRPFFAEPPLDAIRVIGTQLEECDGRLTGRFLTPNCYGPEKVRRVEMCLPAPRSACHIIAYGDSRGDKELLAYADERYFRALE